MAVGKQRNITIKRKIIIAIMLSNQYLMEVPKTRVNEQHHSVRLQLHHFVVIIVLLLLADDHDKNLIKTHQRVQMLDDVVNTFLCFHFFLSYLNLYLSPIGNDPGRNHSIPTNSRYPARNNYSNTNTANKTLPTQANPSETIPSSKPKEEIASVASSSSSSSSSADEYDFTGGATQSLTFDNSQKPTISSTTKRPMPSSIPQQPVSMHPTVQFSTEPIDIQFGDVQWNDSVPMTITPSNSSVLVKALDNQQLASIANVQDHDQQAEYVVLFENIFIVANLYVYCF